MKEQTQEWTEQDEKEWQKMLDDQESQYQQNTSENYALRGLSNIY